MKKIIIGIIIAAVIFTGAAMAASAAPGNPPQFPAAFYGTIQTTDGQNIPAGTVVTAEFNGNTFTYVVAEDGKIGGAGAFDDKLIISTDGSVSESAKKITFRIGSETSEVTDTYSPGKVSEIALKFDNMPVVSTPEPASSSTPESSVTATDIPSQTAPQGSSDTPSSDYTKASSSNPTDTKINSKSETQTSVSAQTEKPAVTQSPATPSPTAVPTKTALPIFGILAGLACIAVLKRR